MFSPAQEFSSSGQYPPTNKGAAVSQPEFDFYYRRLTLVFNGNKEAAKAAATRLRQRLADTTVAQEAPGAPLTLTVCELYGEYGPDIEAARESYQQQKGAQPNDAD